MLNVISSALPPLGNIQDISDNSIFHQKCNMCGINKYLYCMLRPGLLSRREGIGGTRRNLIIVTIIQVDSLHHLIVCPSHLHVLASFRYLLLWHQNMCKSPGWRAYKKPSLVIINHIKLFFCVRKKAFLAVS